MAGPGHGMTTNLEAWDKFNAGLREKNEMPVAMKLCGYCGRKSRADSDKKCESCGAPPK